MLWYSCSPMLTGPDANYRDRLTKQSPAFVWETLREKLMGFATGGGKANQQKVLLLCLLKRKKMIDTSFIPGEKFTTILINQNERLQGARKPQRGNVHLGH